ncbi:MAG: PD-(D/E)XK nuclease family protein [Spirochaetaceae bacterium]|jgi:CRISPR/Cas system-associated exonuclease Cas4 (RecB family)|nr:PD-(D/E)XK nuclease family protein [Spirochaetaceae bacterium]
MASVFDTILGSIADQNTGFVFPSETAAMLWARKLCLHGGIRSLTPERFLAWDRFKEVSVRAREKNKKPASSLIRRLFAFSLVRQNAASPFLSALIPVEYAESGGVFADSIAMMLSSLGRWESLQEVAGRDDEEDRDLRIIKSKYAAFLDEHNLFEPSWEKAAFCGNESRHIIFFPEALADFAEYAELLDTQTVTIYSTDEFLHCGNYAKNQADFPGLLFFDSARQEIRSAVLELRRLYEEGLSYEDMAVTLPDYKRIAPYVERELALHDIPFIRRAGKGLGEYPVGRLFSLISTSTVSLFSFDTLKPLLLDHSIPWKEPEKNRALINYGIANHCVAPFKDRSRIIDAWEEGFKRNPSEALSAYYRGLKQAFTALYSAKSFRAIMENYFAFRPFLDMEKCGAESNAVLARCIEELSVLADAETEFPDICPPNPFDFFVSHLRDKNYVYAQEGGGVNLYDYPVAAGSPYGCHLVLNASQAAATVQHRPLAFLRPDKRARLGVEDKDASRYVLALYNIAPWKDYACHTRISASEKTFTGWAIPHSAFAVNTERRNSAAADSGDYFSAERLWRAFEPTGRNQAGQEARPERLYAVQREGFRRWNAVLQSSPGIDAPLAAELPEDGTCFSAEVESLLRERIRNKSSKNTGSPAAIPNEFSVSATDLNEFFTCPVLWLYRRVFRLERYLEDAALLDDEARGLIYHEILRRLFARISEADRHFNKENLALYFMWADECTAAVLRSDDTLRGPLVYPLLAPLAESINRRLKLLLENEALYFNGFEVKELEQRYDLIQGHLRLTGRIDRVSLSPQGPMIIDYKTNNVPSKKSCRKENEGIGLVDFQIPMYIKLYEAAAETTAKAAGIKVDRAFFISIVRHEIVPVMGELEGKRGLCSREEYQPSMDALEEAITFFDSAVSTLNFKSGVIPYKICPSCEYKTICRFLYQSCTA